MDICDVENTNGKFEKPPERGRAPTHTIRKKNSFLVLLKGRFATSWEKKKESVV